MTLSDAAPPPSAVATTPLSDAQRRRSLRASTAGNILEWYEWTTYSALSPFIAKAMFDSSDPSAALLSVFAVFAVGFLMRPIGGVLFGIIGDRIGRRAVLIITMLSMAAACLAIGLLPTYASIGIWSSALLLLLRCIQGFAHGGESSASATYVSEIAPPARRGLWGSAAGMAIIGGSLISFLVSAALTSALGADAMQEWGWRIPFLLGGVMAIVVLWMRREMHESDVFTETKAEESDPVEPPARRAVVLAAVRLIAFIAGLTCFNYVWMTFMTTYAISEKGMSPGAAYWVTALGQLICLVITPFMGRLSDRIGRKPMMFGYAALAVIFTFPFTALVNDQPWTLFVTVTAGLSIWAMCNSIFPALLAENFPTRLRGRGVGFSYSIAVALFGGTAPYLNQLFVSLDKGWVFNLYVMGLCSIGFVVTFFFKETRGINLNDVRLDR